MSRPPARLLPLGRPGPHGAPVIHCCRGCLKTAATYPGFLPKDWRPEVGTSAVYCPACWRPGGRAALQPASQEIR